MRRRKFIELLAGLVFGHSPRVRNRWTASATLAYSLVSLSTT
jgi:hypothetical protein